MSKFLLSKNELNVAFIQERDQLWILRDGSGFHFQRRQVKVLPQKIGGKVNDVVIRIRQLMSGVVHPVRKNEYKGSGRIAASLPTNDMMCPQKTYPLLSGSIQTRRTEMTKTSRARYTLEFKQEAVRLVEGGQSIAAAARTLGVVDQTLFNWVKAHKQGNLKGADSKPVSAEQMEISRLRAELARVKMERDILGKATAYFAKGSI